MFRILAVALAAPGIGVALAIVVMGLLVSGLGAVNVATMNRSVSSLAC